jgi:DNA mismatch repair protein MutS
MSLTPMMQQYHDAKEKHPGTVLLFRMGDFYELFGDDAVAISKELQLTLTSRDKQLPMAGFPHHSLEPHLRKLIERGHRVAICEQMEDPAVAKGIVKREVVRVVTPGTLTEENLLDPKRANHLAAVLPGRDKVGLAWIDLSSGVFGLATSHRNRSSKNSSVWKSQSASGPAITQPRYSTRSGSLTRG